MADRAEEIHKLEQQLFNVTLKQHTLSTEIQQLREELKRLKYSREEQPEVATEQIQYVSVEVEKESRQAPDISEIIEKPTFAREPKPIIKQEKSNIEKFIGENLISKIGIAITVLGAAIGVKYSIEHQLVSPLMRIILGYLLGFGLLGVGIKLKEKYENYSAVLVSGAIAIMYFITYAGYSFYGLIPQALTFVLMLAFTIFSVIAAIHYNRQVIAQIGLVGAYAVPFLLSNNSGQVAVLFSYMAIINVGILVISYKKYWKSLYYSSFVLTWLIYSGWFAFSYKVDAYFGLALTFLCVFFAIFYAVFLLHKLVRKDQYKLFDIVPLMVNSFLFYGIGYAILNSHTIGRELLGLFTLANAVIHFIVSVIIYKQKLVDKNLLYLIIVLVFTFITITVPVQLSGHWITLLWLAEACLLFVIGRVKNISVFEKISYPLMLLGFISLIMDWDAAYGYGSYVQPVFNIQFLTSMLASVAFGCITWFHFKRKEENQMTPILNIILPASLLVMLYFSIRLEIANFYDVLHSQSKIDLIRDSGYNYPIFNDQIDHFKQIWLINYSLLFTSLLCVFNIFKIKDKAFGLVSSALSVIFLFAFLTFGLYSLSELRESYLNPSMYYNVTIVNIIIRYVSLAFVALTGFVLHKQIRQSYMPDLKIGFDFVLYGSLLWIVSSELIHWLDMAGFAETYKLGLSILWGVYALLIIVLGIWKKKKHLRIGGIAVFGVTLIKLFFYDLSSLNTISKTIVLVLLGILLLIVSFLYNKYKHLIENEEVK